MDSAATALVRRRASNVLILAAVETHVSRSRHPGHVLGGNSHDELSKPNKEEAFSAGRCPFPMVFTALMMLAAGDIAIAAAFVASLD